MMNRKAYILLLMYLAWPVNLAHRVLTDRPAAIITPFPFSVQDISVQWYVYMLLDIVSWIMIFWAIWLYITGNYKQDKDFKTIYIAYFIILCIDLPHYLLYFRRSEIIVFIEGAIIMTAAFITMNRAFKRQKKCSSK